MAVDPRLGPAQKGLEKFSQGSGSIDNCVQDEGLIDEKKGTSEPKGIIRPPCTSEKVWIRS